MKIIGESVRTKIVFMVVLLLFYSNAAFNFTTDDGKLVIYNYHLDELLETQYRNGGKYNDTELKKIQHIFRSRLDDKEYPIDIKLIELIDHLQDHFNADSIELISGYRSPELNKKLKMEGTSVADESLHMKGLAADIHIDEVTEEALAEYARGLKAGGVGYYPANDFVHVDIGRVKKWNLPDRPGRELVAFRKGLEWQVMTDKNIYLAGDAITYEITNLTTAPKKLKTRPVLEIFRRGGWKEVVRLKEIEGKQTLTGIKEFGKYRIRIPDPKDLPDLQPLSNEFYRKRL